MQVGAAARSLPVLDAPSQGSTPPSVERGPVDSVMLGVSSPGPAATSAPAPASTPTPAPTPAPPPTPRKIDPFPAIEGVNRYCRDMRETDQSEPTLHGIVFEQYADGTVKVLERPGETVPDVPAGGPDIPSDA